MLKLTIKTLYRIKKILCKPPVKSFLFLNNCLANFGKGIALHAFYYFPHIQTLWCTKQGTLTVLKTGNKHKFFTHLNGQYFLLKNSWISYLIPFPLLLQTDSNYFSRLARHQHSKLCRLTHL